MSGEEGAAAPQLSSWGPTRARGKTRAPCLLWVCHDTGHGRNAQERNNDLLLQLHDIGLTCGRFSCAATGVTWAKEHARRLCCVIFDAQLCEEAEAGEEGRAGESEEGAAPEHGCAGLALIDQCALPAVASTTPSHLVTPCASPPRSLPPGTSSSAASRCQAWSSERAHAGSPRLG